MTKSATRLAIIALIALLAASCGDSGTNDQKQPADPVVRSMAHMGYLSDRIGPRVAGSEAESAALNYVRAQFLALGYQPEVRPFAIPAGDPVLGSANVVALLQGQSAREIIVGAHYDSVVRGRGYIDNGSGVGLMLAIAERLQGTSPPFTIRFIAFGAEEIGFVGSRYYAAKMSGAEIANTIGMLNLDTVVGGDMIYAYGGADGQGWMRDQALAIAAKLRIDLKTNPGLNPAYPKGTTGDWSDHAPFRALGIDYLYFEATNWDIGDLSGWLETERFGAILHTEMDDPAFFDREYPGRVESQLRAFALVFEEFLLTMDPPASKRIPGGQPARRAIQVRYLHRDGTPIEHLPSFEERP
jgi:alkaline phosphatase isozyme conversion protein